MAKEIISQENMNLLRANRFPLEEIWARIEDITTLETLEHHLAHEPLICYFVEIQKSFQTKIAPLVNMIGSMNPGEAVIDVIPRYEKYSANGYNPMFLDYFDTFKGFCSRQELNNGEIEREDLQLLVENLKKEEVAPEKLIKAAYERLRKWRELADDN